MIPLSPPQRARLIDAIEARLLAGQAVDPQHDLAGELRLVIEELRATQRVLKSFRRRAAGIPEE